MTKTLNEAERNVEMLLEKNPALRNDDVKLIFEYWRTFDKADVNIKCRSKPLTKPATIIRRRQEIQAENKLLPTNAKVRHKRGKLE
jgi:hypothetical protein